MENITEMMRQAAAAPPVPTEKAQIVISFNIAHPTMIMRFDATIDLNMVISVAYVDHVKRAKFIPL